MKVTERKVDRILLPIIAVIAVTALVISIISLTRPESSGTDAIPTVSQQVEDIKNTIPELETTGTELRG